MRKQYQLVALLAGIVVMALFTSPAMPQSAADGFYRASVSGQATTAAVLLSVEAPSTHRLRLVRVCIGSSGATAAAAVTVTVRRTTTASSGGTALTAEGTGTTAVSKLAAEHVNFTGVARLGGTPGTAGATIDQWGFTVGELGAGAADPASLPIFCEDYEGIKSLVVPAGTANGFSINVSAAGAGGLSSGAISATFATEK